ncbi:MAG: type II toxin-antitoxin system prevent-host-death family antitoxin [Pseudomonadota bacterium]|uniref:type II toxin-antitoxin system prevent-host-death family antitoxin n=1 Tax=Polaromonas sp. TaxID=1869339 RepID=UPI001799C320|nr:type II toxin-antitoxin system prevent-host-death family antitoxin [Polaromonas sp.]MBA3593641.1 type II toxin-antitoxin system prevent-host-death family antitoxin [Polaromonas sp.]MDQ3272222.1 type II toxin-antitoxin system prevent-host-death family antitoxin [Pseudomonadota bacterium]
MEAFAIRDLREHTGELVRNAESGQFSVVSKHGRPLFVAMPFTDELLSAGVSVSLADRLVQSGELSTSSGAKLAGMPYARYLQHLGAMGYSLLDDTARLEDELALLDPTEPVEADTPSPR